MLPTQLRPAQGPSSASFFSRTRRPKFATLCLLCVLLLAALGVLTSILSGPGSGASRFSRRFKSTDIEHFGVSASHDLKDCVPSSKAAICKWARQYTRAKRKRPADWKPKPGWVEASKTTMQHSGHTSERSLSALPYQTHNGSNVNDTVETLQDVLHAVWPLQEQQQPATGVVDLAQCLTFAGHTCVAIIGDDTIVPNDVHACLVIRVLHTAQSDICGHAADIWVTDQPAGSSQYLGMLDGQLPCSQHQALQRTTAIWYLGGSQEQAGSLHSSSGFRNTISAVHFPLDVWNQRYTARFATEMQPSALWIGLMSVLECVPGTTRVHVFVSQDAAWPCTRCNVSAEVAFLQQTTAASLTSFHRCAPDGCRTQEGLLYQAEQGLAAAGLKLYPHTAKWHQSRGRIYPEDEENEVEEA